VAEPSFTHLALERLEPSYWRVAFDQPPIIRIRQQVFEEFKPRRRITRQRLYGRRTKHVPVPSTADVLRARLTIRSVDHPTVPTVVVA